MSDYKKFSDIELVSLLKVSDHAAYTEIYNRYFYLMYTHAYKKLRNEEQAKDMVQELFTNLWLKRERPLKAINLGGYLYTSIRNRIFDLFVHQQVESKYILSLKGFIATGNSAAPDYLIREKELEAYINKEIQALPPRMREIFTLSRKDQFSYKEIAEKLNTNENNVAKQVNNGLKILKKKLGMVIYLSFILGFLS